MAPIPSLKIRIKKPPMARQFPKLSALLSKFISEQRLFFVATAPAEGRVNNSPKGMDALRVLTPSRIVWLNVTGSGNETAAHVLENQRMTLMWCAFQGPALILRVYGRARAVHPGDSNWEELADELPEIPGARQIFDLEIDMVQTSCGKAVPNMKYAGDRELLNEWAMNKDGEQMADYWAENNRLSIDGLATGILQSPPADGGS